MSALLISALICHSDTESALPRGDICDAHFSLEFKKAYVISGHEGPRDDGGETPSRRQKEDKCPAHIGSI